VRWRRVSLELLLLACVGLILGVLGPYRTGEAPTLLRTVYWLLAALGSGSIGIAVDSVVGPRIRLFWVRVSVVALVMTPPVTLYVYGLNAWLLDLPRRWWLLPQLAWQLSHSYGESFSHWQLGWMTARGESPIAFWVRNLGVLLPILAAAPWWLRRWPARGFTLHLLAPCLALFAIANVYLFQPHAYDNLKLLFYAYLALALGAARLLAGWWRRRGWAGRVTAAACVLLATASGGVSVLRESILHWPLLDGDEVAIGMELRRLTPPDARFLTADNHDHPVPIVAGRRIVLGYRGWLWTYGLHVAPVLADVQTIYAGGEAAPLLLRSYEVDYVFIGPGERRAFPVNDAFFAIRYPLLLERGPFLVYGTYGGGAGGAKVPASAGSQ